MNRGSDDMLSVDFVLAAPSMRPRFMNRGSQLHTQKGLCRSSPFNEAPIHESGKSARSIGERR